jgi:hypothetical protein
LQFSLAIEAIEEYEMMSKLPTALLPIIWAEEGTLIAFIIHVNLIN